MAYINKRDHANAIIKVTIQFGKKLNCENDDDAVITLREPTELEVLQWREAQQAGVLNAMKEFRDLLVGMTISHNLMETELDTRKLRSLAVRGRKLVDAFGSKVSQFNRALGRRKVS